MSGRWRAWRAGALDDGGLKAALAAAAHLTTEREGRERCGCGAGGRCGGVGERCVHAGEGTDAEGSGERERGAGGAGEEEERRAHLGRPV